MKVVIINGSPRKNGVTAEALHLVENELVKEGIDVEFYNLSEINMSHCLGCCFSWNKTSDKAKRLSVSGCD